MFKLAGLFLSVLLMLQSGCCANSDEIQDDDELEVARSHEVVDSFPRTYNAAQYPWRLWNFPYYQPRIPQIPVDDGGAGSPPLADPRFVTNRCSHRQSYYPTTTYPCWTTTVTFTTATFTTTTTITTTVYPTTTTYPTTDTTTAGTITTTSSTDPPTTTGYPTTTPTTSAPTVPVDCGISKFMSRPSRIMGGSEATPNEFPWMVRFLLQNITSGEVSTCGGTLISDRHIITAPHCFYDVEPIRFSVNVLNITLGSHDLNINSSDHFLQFAKWSAMGFNLNMANANPIDNGINLVILQEPLILNDYVKPACLPFENDSDQVNETVVLTGWGAYSSADASSVLRKTVTTVVPSNETNGQCQHGPGTFSSDTLICSDGSQQRHYCKGDDGGPMNFYHEECNRWFVIGVAGRGDSSIDCQSSNKPNVYTRVRNQLNWIRANTGKVSPGDCQPSSDAGTVPNVTISEQLTTVTTTKQSDDKTITTMTNLNQIIAL